MNEGDVVLASLPQSDGRIKHRPSVLLRAMPGFGDLLVCGISTQLDREVSGFDESISPKDSDFAASGLKAPSLIRLGFLAVLPSERFLGSIGALSPERHQRLMAKLSQYLRPRG